MSSRKEYEMLFQLNAQVGGSYSAAFSKAQAQVSAMQQKIVDLGKTQSDIAAYQKQQSAIEATRKKLETLQQQYGNIQKEIDATEGFSSDLENRLLSKKQAIEKTTAALEQQTQKAQQMGAALQNAGVDTKNLAGETDRLTAEIQELKAEQQGVTNGFDGAAESARFFGKETVSAAESIQQVFMVAGIAQLIRETGDAMKACTKESIVFESAITGVYKTVDGSEQQLAAISDEIKHLSTDIPATTKEISAVAEAAGQLGIATGDVMEFSEVMINLGESTNLTADEAASSLAKFSNITGTTADNYSRLGSVIVDLGNNFATTEADIVAMATKLASSGKLAGMTEPEIMALATAMSSVGIEAEAGGTAMSQTFAAIEEAVAVGGDRLTEFARISGLSAEEFSVAWKTSPIQAVQAFITGIGELDQQGESATLVLDELGLSGIRQSNMLKSLGLASGTLAKAVSTANTAWNQNIALSTEAEKRYATTESHLAMLNNSYSNLKVAIGDVYTPALRDASDVGVEVLDGMAQFVEKNPEVVKLLTSLGLGVVAAGVAIGGVALATKLATPVMAAFNAVIAMNPVVLGTVGVIGLGTAIASLCSMTDDEAIPSVKELTEAAQAMNDAVEQSTETYNDSFASTMAAATVAETYIDKLRELEAAGIDTDEEAQQYHNTLALLCQVVPDLASYIDLESDIIRGGTAALDANTEAWKQNALQQAYQEHLTSVTKAYSDVLVEAEKNNIKLTNATKDKGIAEQKVRDIEEQMTALLDEANEKAAYLAETEGYLGTGAELVAEEHARLTAELNEANAELAAATSAENAYKKAIEETADEVELAEQEITLAKEAVNNLTQATEDGADGQDNSAQQFKELQGVISDVIAEMTSLTEAYTEAYNAAYSSVTGQYAIWDQAAKIIPTSVDSINSALGSQVTYWQDYNSDLQGLTARAGEIKGLQEMLASFTDGSAESVNAVAGMATATDDELAAMVEDWLALQAEQDKVANSIAELKENFSAEVDAMATALAEDIEAMNLCEEAAASGKSTIEGFVNGANDMLPQVQAAYASIAQAAINAIDNTLDINSPSREMEYRAEMTWAGYINQTKAMEPDVAAAMSEAVNLGARAVELQAIGAPLSAVEAPTEAAVAGESTSLPPIHVTVNVEGNATTDTAEDLRDVAGELVEAVLEAIDERESNKQRTRYS